MMTYAWVAMESMKERVNGRGAAFEANPLRPRHLYSAPFIEGIALRFRPWPLVRNVSRETRRRHAPSVIRPICRHHQAPSHLAHPSHLAPWSAAGSMLNAPFYRLPQQESACPSSDGRSDPPAGYAPRARRVWTRQGETRNRKKGIFRGAGVHLPCRRRGGRPRQCHIAEECAKIVHPSPPMARRLRT
jgi:hypothetical protein